MLNLAITINQLVEIYESSDLNGRSYTKLQAVTILEDLERSYPRFAEYDKVLYFKAILLEDMKEKDLSKKTWLKLSNVNPESKFAVHPLLWVIIFSKQINQKQL